jgi:acyl-CoA synthetase (AMP-forming)/AMP-acid ligase II
VLKLVEMRADDIYNNPLPLLHIAGQCAGVYSTLIAGATVILPGAFSLQHLCPRSRTSSGGST